MADPVADPVGSQYNWTCIQTGTIHAYAGLPVDGSIDVVTYFPNLVQLFFMFAIMWKIFVEYPLLGAWFIGFNMREILYSGDDIHGIVYRGVS